MTSSALVITLTSALLLYVVAKLLAVILSRSESRAAAGYGGIVVGIVAPMIAFLLPSGFRIPAQDVRIFAFGAALWTTLALALAAFALSRTQVRPRSRR